MDAIQFGNQSKQLLRHLENTYISKNADYGSSAQSTFYKYGPVAYSVRLSDKASRINTLFKQEQFVVQEKIQDTMQDSVNYLMMYLSDTLRVTLYADNSAYQSQSPSVPNLYEGLKHKLNDTKTIEHMATRALHAGELQLWYLIAIAEIDKGQTVTDITSTIYEACLIIITYIIRSEEEVIPC